MEYEKWWKRTVVKEVREYYTKHGKFPICRDINCYWCGEQALIEFKF